jgi:hypothetical protein
LVKLRHIGFGILAGLRLDDKSVSFIDRGILLPVLGADLHRLK